MLRRLRHTRSMVFAIAATAVVLGAVPVANAAPPVSRAGGADAVISELQDRGYNVSINWVNGYDTKPLSQCQVTNVNNPGNQPPSPDTFTTVYVDVACPNGDDDGFGFGAGIG